jgi:hypothetical protein
MVQADSTNTGRDIASVIAAERYRRRPGSRPCKVRCVCQPRCCGRSAQTCALHRAIAATARSDPELTRSDRVLRTSRRRATSVSDD